MGFWKSVKKGVSNVGSGIANAGSDVVRGTATTIASTGRAVGNTLQAGGDLLTGDLSGAKSNLTQAGGNLGSAFDGVVRTATAPMNLVVPNYDNNNTLGNTLGNTSSSTTGWKSTGTKGLTSAGAGEQTQPAVSTVNPTAPVKPEPEVPQYMPTKTPEQMQAERVAAAQAKDAEISAQMTANSTAPDGTVKRYNVKDFDEGAFNEAEQLYQDQTIEGLKTGKFADVQSAEARSGRDNAMRTTRGQQAGEAAAAAAGFKPGTQEYNRAVDLATSNAESQNMQDSNAVRQMQRNYYSDAMNRGQAIGEQMFGRASGERTMNQAADALEYSRADKTFNDSQQDIRDYISSLPPQLQSKAQQALAQGKDPRSATGWFDATGAVSSEYRGASPAQQTFETQQQEAKFRTPQKVGETDQAFQERLAETTRGRLAVQDRVSTNPMTGADKTNDIQNKVSSTLESFAQTGRGLDATSWKTMNQTRPDLMQSIPTTQTITSKGYSKTAKTGDVVEHNGKKYMVVNPQYHHTREDWSGNTVAKDGILVLDENGNEIGIGMTKEYDPD